MNLTVVGLGPGVKKYLSLEALECLEAAKLVLTRTEQHPTIAELKSVNFQSYDDYYDKYESFDEVYQAIADDILRRLQSEDVVYTVPGNPFLAEKTVNILLAELGEKIRFIHGSSFMDVLLTELGFDLSSGFDLINALELPRLTPNNKPLLIIQSYDNVVAGELKIWLGQAFKDEQEVVIVQSIGTEQQRIIKLPLYEMDRYQDYDHLTSVLVLPEDEHSRRDFTALLEIVRHLRSDQGCAWDRAQTHQSVRQNFLEEAYEVAEAIELEDIYGLEEELGDMLLQVLFHAQIASENGDFVIEDVIEGIADKLVIRHPHVYGDAVAENAEQAHKNWNQIKKDLAEQKTEAEVLQKYSRGLPASFRMQKILHKAAKVGYKLESNADYLAELKNAVNLATMELEQKQSITPEKLANIALNLIAVIDNLDYGAEDILHAGSEQFIDKFARKEADLSERKSSFSELNSVELKELWQEKNE